MIKVLLQERASQRPNIYQVHERLCKMRGTQIKLENVRTLCSSANDRADPLSI